jgi:Ca2+-transporting ATPase
VRDGELVGDPTEGALQVAAGKAGVDAEATRAAHPRLAEVPFDSAIKYMVTFHRVVGSDLVRMWVKGAPDVLLRRSRSVRIDDDPTLLEGAPLEAVESELDRMAQKGLRVLALAHRDLDLAEWEACRQMQDDARHDLAEGLQLDALVGILDPPRPEAREAIDLCHRAGIAVKMITGDHAATASAIAADLGIRGDALTGAQLDELDDEELSACVGRVGVFARVTPEHKLRLVRVLQGRGGVVAMTGDGVNDAPALKQADMGVAMGITGTEVTKEAATMVLSDDNFATIVEAVRRGRTIYDNIIKFVRFQLSTTLGFGIAFLVSSAAAIAGGKPFTALQILWVNLIMDGPPAMALGVDPPAKGTMQRRPRTVSDQILSPSRITRLVFLGTIMAVGTLGVLVSAPGYVSGAAVAGTVAGTMAFTTFVFFQFFNLVNSRAEHGTAFTRDLFSNAKLWAIVGTVALLQVAVVHLPVLQSLFDTTSLTLGQWWTCVAVASSVLWLEELRKLVAGRLRRGAER